VVPVTDVERARRFYSEQAGFAVDHDTRISDDMHIVQLTPPGSACSIVVGKGIVEMAPGSVQGLQLVVPDIQAARSQLAEAGVEVSQVQHYEGSDRVDGPGGPWNSFVFFSDPDGNGWTGQERPPRRARGADPPGRGLPQGWPCFWTATPPPSHCKLAIPRERGGMADAPGL